MLKKIKDLTQEEVNNICRHYNNEVGDTCKGCQLFNSELDFVGSCRKYEEAMKKHLKILEREVEVE